MMVVVDDSDGGSGLWQVVNVMEWSADGQHLAAGCVDGVIAVFNWHTRKMVEQ